MSRKFTVKEVSDYFESQNCKLISKEYKGNRVKLEYECECGRVDFITFGHFKDRGQRCSECAKSKRAESRRRFYYEDIKNDFENNGCTLITSKEEYISVNFNLDYICKCGNKHKINYLRFKKGVRCPNCAGNNVKTFEEVLAVFGSLGYKVNSNQSDYTNGKSMLEIICPKGHITNKSVNKFIQNRNQSIGNCYECRNDKIGKFHRFDYDFVKGYFEDNGCELLETNYKESTLQPLSYKCICGNESKISFNQFKNRGARCQECRKKKMSELLSGENHYNYNPFLTETEREEKRANKEYRDWKKTVFKRDNFQCVCCSSIEGINAHHKNSWNAFPEQRYNVSNGVTLCESCHIEFHHFYGYGFNTEEQFEEFSKEYLEEFTEAI